MTRKRITDPVYTECPHCGEPTVPKKSSHPDHADIILMECSAVSVGTCTYSAPINKKTYDEHMSRKNQ